MVSFKNKFVAFNLLLNLFKCAIDFLGCLWEGNKYACVFTNEGALREDFEEIWYVKVCYEKQFSISTAFSKLKSSKGA